MPLKLKRKGQTLPINFTTLSGAFAHFLATWYEKPDEPMDTLEIRHAFYAGATYMKALVQQATNKTAPEVQAHISRLYKELIDEHARNAASSWVDRFIDRQAAPTPRMDLPGTAPGPKPDFVITGPDSPAPTPGPERTGEGQDQATPQPMMWTIGMVREFHAGYEGAKAVGAPTFPFKGRVFRTVDAPAIINHLRQVFANDQPKPPQQ